MNLASKQMAVKRTVYGSGGVAQEFVEKEAIQNDKNKSDYNNRINEVLADNVEIEKIFGE